MLTQPIQNLKKNISEAEDLATTNDLKAVVKILGSLAIAISQGESSSNPINLNININIGTLNQGDQCSVSGGVYNQTNSDQSCGVQGNIENIENYHSSRQDISHGSIGQVGENRGKLSS